MLGLGDADVGHAVEDPLQADAGLRPGERRAVPGDAGDELGVCPINIAEFYSGLDTNHYARWDAFFHDLKLWPISGRAARQAGSWRFHFKQQGITLATADVLIAAVAQEQRAIIVTDNTKDYPMDEVELHPIMDPSTSSQLEPSYGAVTSTKQPARHFSRRCTVRSNPADASSSSSSCRIPIGSRLRLPPHSA